MNVSGLDLNTIRNAVLAAASVGSFATANYILNEAKLAWCRRCAVELVDADVILMGMAGVTARMWCCPSCNAAYPDVAQLSDLPSESVGAYVEISDIASTTRCCTAR